MYSKQNILITGANGFVGKYLITNLAKNKNYNIIAGIKDIEPYCENNINFINLDITNLECFNKIKSEIDYIIHLAAYIPAKEDISDINHLFEVNEKGTLNTLIFAAQKKIKKFIFFSSISVYGEKNITPFNENALVYPDSFYGLSKFYAEKLCEMMCSQNKINHLCFRCSSIYGYNQPSKTVLPLFIEKVRNNQNIYLFDKGERFQDFVYIEDIIELIAENLKNAKTGIFNIGSGTITTMKELADYIIEIFGKNKNINILYKGQEKSRSLSLDISLAKEILDYNPIFNVKKGLKNMYNRL